MVSADDRERIATHIEAQAHFSDRSKKEALTRRGEGLHAEAGIK
jgi:hypothetical protein